MEGILGQSMTKLTNLTVNISKTVGKPGVLGNAPFPKFQSLGAALGVAPIHEIEISRRDLSFLRFPSPRTSAHVDVVFLHPSPQATNFHSKLDSKSRRCFALKK